MTVGAAARIVDSGIPLDPYPDRVTDDLVRWAREKPHAPYLAERDGDRWRTIDYGTALARVRTIGAGLLDAGGDAEHPVAVLGENAIDVGLAILAGMYAGVPVSPLSTGYARADADPARLRALLDVLGAVLAYVPDPRIADRVRAADPALRVVSDLGALAGDPERADAANARVGPETIAKVLFTSGSTGTPKGVITTNRMLSANQTMVQQIWPMLREPLVLVDWAPWSHTAAGNKTFGMVLRSGGTLYIDAGKPMPGLFEITVRNLREVSPTYYFNVPRGWALLADALERDDVLARRFFAKAKLLLSAAASLPDSVRLRIEALIRRYADRPVPMVSSWGATETAPMATACYGDRPASLETVGAAIPGVELKLAPVGDRCELRVRGVTVTPGYWRNAAATAAAFDEDGFYKSGDAASLFDENDPSRGIVFGGRLAENFKLSSGTWVNVGQLRVALLDAAVGLLDDAAFTGADREEIGAILFVSHAAKEAPDVEDRVRAVLRDHNARNAGSSMRIARALIADRPPDATRGEITDKGSLNQRRVLENRAAEVAALTAPLAAAGVLVLD